MKDKIKQAFKVIYDFLRCKSMKRLYWTTLDSSIGIAITYFSGISWLYAPVIVAVLTGATKEINNYISQTTN